ncbi:phosphodiester glycosidase family protein [Cohnella abietis]|uniref:SLH domain-containing protein n=1 Tax=Cohnella abietis TaxID=2507935 RepID=A0A3T1CYK8_9BACL|nr:phosphodiester glycosidase family protein [Cohnella abietis]BBI30943.1 hypothetical protein KCTCHS21_03420 [Cohnella abietis]
MIRNLQRKFALLLSTLLMLSVFFPFGQAFADSSGSYGQILDKRSSEIGPGATYNWYNLKDSNGLQKIETIEFDPANPALQLQPGLKSNGKVYGMTGVTKMANNADKPGNKVIAGINGDFYDLANGVPLGFFMGDGRILISPPSDWNAFAVKADGTTMYGPSPTLTRTVKINGQTKSITDINRTRGTNSLNLYTFDYNSSTATSDLGDEVVLNIVSGDMRSGQTLALEVASVKKGKGDTPLVAGQVVLSAAGTSRSFLDALKPGDQVTISLQLSSSWNDVIMSIGGSTMLVIDGVVPAIADPTVAPRTAIGTKADGKVILFEVDGRQPGFSEGVTLQQLGQLMKDMGAVTAMNLDGGGSSTMVVRPAGEIMRKIMNSPSDGGERSTSNGILLVNKAAEGPATKLVVTPNLERVLTGTTSVLFLSLGVDNNIHPATSTGTPVWSADPAIGTIDSTTGRLTAGNLPGIGAISVTANGISGTAQVEVVDHLTELQFPDKLKTFSPGKSEKLKVAALKEGQVIQADNSLLQWSADPSIGTIDSNGVFTATTGTEKTGKITVAYKGVSASLDVNVGIPPVILEDFEKGLDRYKITSGAQYVKSIASIETENEDFIRFGKGSLKLDYDFTGTPGTSGSYLQTSSTANNIEIQGYPEKISMWVYGDGKKHWLRSQIRDAKGAIALDFVDQTTGINFTGWKYLEAAVPKGRELPLTMDMPVRYMETSAAKKDAGTIYIDQIRALYGPANDDMDPPIIRNITPAEGAIITKNQPEISVIAEDFGYDKSKHPGTTLIDPDKIRMYIDGSQVHPTLYPPEGRIFYTPAVPLADGVHQAKVQVKDLSGNQTTKIWTFQVDTGASKLLYTTPTALYTGETYTVDIKAKNASMIKSANISFNFDPSKVDNLQVVIGNKLSSGELTPTVDSISGTVSLNINDLSSLGLTDQDNLAQIKYLVKPNATEMHVLGFKAGNIAFTNTGNTIFPFFGLPIQSTIKNKLQLSWNYDGIVQGFNTEFKVIDENGKPVADAKLSADGVDIGTTNAEGILTTDALTKVVKSYQLQANEGISYSSVMPFKVSALSGTPNPKNINISMGEDPSVSRAFTWQTIPTTTGTVVDIVKQSEFTDFNQPNVKSFSGTSSLYNTYDIGTVRVHKASAIGLEPGTTYVYRVGDGQGNYSQQGAFHTAGSAEDPLKFLYFTDSQAADQAGYTLWGNTVKKALEDNPDSKFMMHVGDMVDSGFKETEWNMWFGAVQQQLLNTTLVAAIGNHEAMQNGNNDFMSHFNQPGNGLPSLKGSNFSFDYGDAHFVVLNSEEKYQEQADWLKQDLSSTNKKWKIAFFHRGPYGSIYDTEIVRKLWAPVFEENGVDLVMNGHDHIYLRTQMKNGKKVEQGSGTAYVVGGSTGPKFYSLTARPWHDKTDEEQTQMYSSVEIVGNQLTFITKTVQGRIVDQFTLQKTVVPTEVTIDTPNATITEGESLQLRATVKPDNLVNKNVIWSVVQASPDDAVTVSQDGKVTGVHKGTAIVRATSVLDNVYGESSIVISSITDPVTDPVQVKIDQENLSFSVGSKVKLAATVLPDNATHKAVTWSVVDSSPDDAVTVSQDGTVTGIREGMAIVRATSVIDSVYGESNITVTAPSVINPNNVIINSPSESLYAGQQMQLTATVMPEDAFNKNVTWSIVNGSDTSAISISAEGSLTAVRPGTAIVRATSVIDSVYGEKMITVNDYPAGSGALPPVSTPVPWDKDSIVTSDELRESLQNGVATLTTDNPLQRIQLPVDAGDILNGAPLQLIAPNVTLTIPFAFIKEQSQNGLISLSFNQDTAETTKQTISSLSQQAFAQLHASGQAFTVGMELKSKDGKTKAITSYSPSLQLKLSVDRSQNSKLVGIYEILDNGKLLYVGGTIKEGHILANVDRAGKYVVLEFNKSFADIKPDFWAKDVINELAAKQLVNGVSSTEFSPAGIVTRAEFISMLVRILGIEDQGSTSFIDVPEHIWYAEAVVAAVKAGIASGVSSTSFKPEASITREEMAVMMVRAYEYATKQKAQKSSNSNSYKDLNNAAPWSRDSIIAANTLGLLQGRSETAFSPRGITSRAESAQAIYNLFVKLSSK